MKATLPSSVLCVIFLSLNLNAQSRYILHLNNNGEQEAIPLHKGEKAWDVISRHEGTATHFPAKANALKDVLFNTPDTATSLNTNFGFNHQDVAFEWFVPPTDGVVKEYHWNMLLTGDIHKGQLRAWNANPALLNLPATAVDATGNMGWYLQAADGDGGVTPFKADADTPKTYQPGVGSVPGISFDPLGTETMGAPGGVEIILQDSTWNSYVLNSADSFKIHQGQPFGFTLQNKSPAGGANGRMELLSAPSTAPPYHSLKFYEKERNVGNADPGWWIRGYEWGVYVVVEYTSGGYSFKIDRLPNTLKTTPRTVNVTAIQGRSAGEFGIQSITLYWKKGSAGSYSGIPMAITSNTTYSADIPGGLAGDTVYYYAEVLDNNNQKTVLPQGLSTFYSYLVYGKQSNILCLYNFRSAVSGLTPQQIAARYFTGIPAFDIWNIGKDGISEFSDLLALFDNVVEITGDGPNPRNFTSYIGPWLATGIPAKPKLYFLSDQDHGWINNYYDTVFADTNVHAKYFGVKKLGPQDYPYTISARGPAYVGYPWELKVASVDSVTACITRYNKANSVKFYYHPYYEWGGLVGSNFYNWMDALTPTTGAKVLFRDSTKWATKTNPDTLSGRVVGVRNQAADKSWSTMFLSFDILGTDFREDTSLAPGADPKYAYILAAGNPIAKFFETPFATEVKKLSNGVPMEFDLQQNYPNPFNPTTQFQFSIAAPGHATLKIFNILGQEVASIVNEELSPGNYSRMWDASGFSSGIYFCRLAAGSFTETRKIVLMK